MRCGWNRSIPLVGKLLAHSVFAVMLGVSSMPAVAVEIGSEEIANELIEALQRNIDQVKELKGRIIADATTVPVPVGELIRAVQHDRANQFISWNIPAGTMTIDLDEPEDITIEASSAQTLGALNVAYYSGLPLFLVTPVQFFIPGAIIYTGTRTGDIFTMDGRNPGDSLSLLRASIDVRSVEVKELIIFDSQDGDVEERYTVEYQVVNGVTLPLAYVREQIGSDSTVTSAVSFFDVDVSLGPQNPPLVTGKTKALVLSAPETVGSLVQFSLTVTAVDKNGDVVKNYKGTITFSSTDSVSDLPADFTFSKADQSQHVFTVALGTPGRQTIFAKDNSITFGASGQVSVGVFPVPSPHEFVLIPGARNYQDLDFFGPNVGWAVGFGFRRPFTVRFDGFTWTRVGAPVPSQTLSCFGVSGSAVSLSRTGSGFMGVQGICFFRRPPLSFQWFQYELSSTSWLAPQAFGEFLPRALTMVTPQDGWQGVLARRETGQIFRFDGDNWNFFQLMPSPTDTEFLDSSVFLKIRFVRGQPNEGWAVDSLGDLFRFQGVDWQSFLETSMLGLWMNAPNDVWACGFNGTILHFDGTAWGQVATPPQVAGATLNAVSFFDANHGVTVGGRRPESPKEDIIILTFDGNWNRFLAVPPEGLKDVRLTEVRMIAQDEAWAAGLATDVSTEATVAILMNIVLPGSHVTEGEDPPTVIAQPLEKPQDSLSITSLKVKTDVSGEGSVVPRFIVTSPCKAILTIVNQEMRTVARFEVDAIAGMNEITWDGRDPGGHAVPAGWYMARLDVSNEKAEEDVEAVIFPLLLPSSAEVTARQGNTE